MAARHEVAARRARLGLGLSAIHWPSCQLRPSPVSRETKRVDSKCYLIISQHGDPAHHTVMMLSSLALSFSAPAKDAVHPERAAQIAHLSLIHI